MQECESLEEYVRELFESCDKQEKVHSRFNYLVETIELCYKEALEKFEEEK